MNEIDKLDFRGKHYFGGLSLAAGYEFLSQNVDQRLSGDIENFMVSSSYDGFQNTRIDIRVIMIFGKRLCELFIAHKIFSRRLELRRLI